MNESLFLFMRALRALTRLKAVKALTHALTGPSLAPLAAREPHTHRCPIPEAMASPACCGCTRKKHDDGLSTLMQQNRAWAAEMLEKDPDFFNRLMEQQNPEYLWIGCSDSRVPANQILGLAPGEIFVQRNVGNQAMHTDMNLMACLEFAVKALKVKTIILCGHYNCGAVKAALQLPHANPGLVNCWISDIRECRNQAERELLGLDPEQQLARLCELNVLRQVFHVATSPVVASAWSEGQEVHLYGLIYDLSDGHLRKLAGPISGDDGYVHSLDSFLTGSASAGGMHVSRCPDTQRLRLSVPEDASSNGDGAGGPASATAAQAERVGDLAASDLYASLATPSEVMSSINSINLAESIAKHKQWSSGALALNRSARASVDTLGSDPGSATKSPAPAVVVAGNATCDEGHVLAAC